MTDFNVFKKLHIPTLWHNIPELVALIKFAHTPSNLISNFDTIMSFFSLTKYKSFSNVEILHDYLYYLIVDVLNSKGVDFMYGDEILDNRLLFRNLAPDFVISRDDQRPVFVDILIGKEKQELEMLGWMFDVVVLDIENLELLGEIGFMEEEIRFIYLNFYLFQIEFNYWESCFELSRVVEDGEYCRGVLKKLKVCDNEGKRKLFVNKVIDKLNVLSN